MDSPLSLISNVDFWGESLLQLGTRQPGTIVRSTNPPKYYGD